MAFRYEKDLNETILKYDILSQSIRIKPLNVYVLEEVKGFFGIPDFVMVDLRKKTRKIEKLYAFESKLRNWRKALTQAFRYKIFVGSSFVVMDLDYVNPALNNISEFKKSNIGLIGVGENGVYNVFFSPKFEKPFREVSYLKLLDYVTTSFT